MKKIFKQNKGITLVALVITIIVLLILSTISISLIIGDNSIINKAIDARNKTNSAKDREMLALEIAGSYSSNGTIDLDSLKNNLENMGATVSTSSFPLSVEFNGSTYEIDENGNIQDENNPSSNPSGGGNNVVTTFGGNWDETAEVNTPKIVPGLIPVTFNNDGTVNELDNNNLSNWYNYSNKQWANAITKNQDGDITGYWVWIPRYEYKVNTEAKSFTVKFIPTTQTTVDSGYDHIHPAFRNGSSNHFMNGEWDSELPGIWIAKFPAGFQQNTITDSNGTLSTTISNSEDELVLSNLNYSVVYDEIENNVLGPIDYNVKLSLPVFLPLTYTYNCISIADTYKLAQEISKSPDFYGLGASTSSHLLKNSEWGAVLYLSQSQYGRNGTEPNKNNYFTTFEMDPYRDSVTGIYADGIDDWMSNTLGNAWYTSVGQLGSSTGNMTGIYDLNGSVSEMVACYIPNGSWSLEENKSDLDWIKTTIDEDSYLTDSSKYYTVYPFDANSDTLVDNWIKYNSLKSATYGYGDAMLEITNTSEEFFNVWFGDETQAGYMYSYFPFFERSGDFTAGPRTASFTYGQTHGLGGEAVGFRVALCP